MTNNRAFDVPHGQTARSTALHRDGTWSGAMSCRCGWSQATEGHRSREAVATSLLRAWLSHAGDVR